MTEDRIIIVKKIFYFIFCISILVTLYYVLGKFPELKVLDAVFLCTTIAFMGFIGYKTRLSNYNFYTGFFTTFILILILMGIKYSIIDFTNSHTAYFITLFITFSLIVLCAIVKFYVLVNKIDISKFYLSLIIPFSLIYLVLFQLWSIPDSGVHFLAAYRQSNNILGIYEQEWFGREDDVDFLTNDWKLGEDTVNLPSAYGIKLYLEKTKMFCVNKELVPFPAQYEGIKFYSILNYFPAVIGILVARLFGLGTIPLIYLARFLTLLFYIFMTYHIVKITPIGKFVFAGIFLLPLSLMYSSAISYDTMVIISSTFFMANIFRLYHDSDNKRYYIESIIASIFLGSVKGGAFIFILLLTTILIKKISRKKLITIISSGIGAMLLFDLILTKTVASYQFGEEGNGYYTVGYALAHPIDYLNKCIETYINNIDYLGINVGGTHLSWLEYTMPAAIIVILFLLIAIYSIREKDEVILLSNHKIVMIAIILIGLITTPAMLLSFTSIGYRTIQGIQARYYLPLTPLVFFVFTKFSLHQQNSDSSLNSIGDKKLLMCFLYILSFCTYYLLQLYMLR